MMEAKACNVTNLEVTIQQMEIYLRACCSCSSCLYRPTMTVASETLLIAGFAAEAGYAVLPCIGRQLKKREFKLEVAVCV